MSTEGQAAEQYSTSSATAAIDQLVAMGFGIEEASSALDKFKGSVERAADWLFTQPASSSSGGGELAQAAPAQSAEAAAVPTPETEELRQLRTRVENAVQRFVGGVAPEWVQARVGLETLNTMLGKILQSPTEDKYRRIRLSNAAYTNKIGKHDGGKEMLLAANFRFSPDGEALQYDRTDPAELLTARQALDAAISSLP